MIFLSLFAERKCVPKKSAEFLEYFLVCLIAPFPLRINPSPEKLVHLVADHGGSPHFFQVQLKSPTISLGPLDSSSISLHHYLFYLLLFPLQMTTDPQVFAA